MFCKDHVKVNAAVAVTGLAVTASQIDWGGSFPDRLSRSILSVFIPSGMSLDFSDGLLGNAVIYVFCACFLLWFGSNLPDIDSEKSTFGRVFHLPVEHRTWTHTIWACLLLAIPCYFHPLWRWLLLGYVLHLIGDSVSAAGLCWTYPLKKYRRYENGAFVAPHHSIKLYRVGDGSDKKFVRRVIIICFIICIFARSGFPKLLDWML